MDGMDKAIHKCFFPCVQLVMNQDGVFKGSRSSKHPILIYPSPINSNLGSLASVCDPLEHRAWKFDWKPIHTVPSYRATRSLCWQQGIFAALKNRCVRIDKKGSQGLRCPGFVRSTSETGCTWCWRIFVNVRRCPSPVSTLPETWKPCPPAWSRLWKFLKDGCLKEVANFDVFVNTVHIGACSEQGILPEFGSGEIKSGWVQVCNEYSQVWQLVSSNFSFRSSVGLGSVEGSNASGSGCSITS